MFISLLLSALISLSPASVKTIAVRNQQDFDGLGEEIRQALEAQVARVEVTFQEGTYYAVQYF